MLSKSQIKLITSLRLKKHREKHNLFFAEGPKVVKELLESAFVAESIFATTPIPGIDEKYVTQISQKELKKISDLKTPNKVLAVFSMPVTEALQLNGLTLVLDDVRDPGNLGTIIRLCDWFGVENILCSKETVDCYNPKVVQATMGSLARVQVHYLDLQPFLEVHGKSMPVYGTFMNGDTIYKTSLKENALVVLGNEANGISEVIESLTTHRISIPKFGKLQKTESLNVATAAAICLSEWRRTTEK